MRWLAPRCLLPWSWAVLLALTSPAMAQSDEPVRLQPFRVLTEMVDLQPILDRKESGKVVGLLIARVSPKSGAERAGLRRGMVVTSIQGIAVVGLSEEALAQRTARIAPTRHHTLILKARPSYASRSEKDYEIILPVRSGEPPPARPAPPSPPAGPGPGAPAAEASPPAALGGIWQVDLYTATVVAMDDHVSVSAIEVTFTRPFTTHRTQLPPAFTLHVWDESAPSRIVHSLPTKPEPAGDSGTRFTASFTPWVTDLTRGQSLRFRLTADGPIDFQQPAVWRGFEARITVKALGKTLVLDERLKLSFVKTR